MVVVSSDHFYSHVFLAFIHLVLGIVAVAFFDSYVVELDNNETVDVKVVICTFPFITSVAHIGYSLNNRNGIYRWVEYSFTASLMFLAIMLLSRETRPYLLLFASCLIIATMICGLLQELYDDSSFYFASGCVPYICAWILELNAFIRAAKETTIPTFVWIILFVQLVLFSSFAFVQYWYICLKKGGDNYEERYDNYEKRLNILSLFSKASLVLIVLFGMKAQN